METQRREKAELQKELESVEQNVQQKKRSAGYEREVMSKRHVSYNMVSNVQDQVCTDGGSVA